MITLCIVALIIWSIGATAASAETLSNYSSHTSDSGNMTVTSSTGQQLKISAYGNYMIRIHMVRSGESFFSNTRYEMVEPVNHSGMGGSLNIVDNGASFTITTAASDGVKVVLQKSPLRVEFYRKSDNALMAKEDSTRSMSWGGTNNSVVKQTFVPAASNERFFKAGHGLKGRSPKLDRTGDIVSHNYGSSTWDQAPAIVPFYLSTNGYGVFFNTTFDTTFNFGNGGIYEFYADDHNTSGVRPQMDYFFIKGPEFAKLIDRYTQLTGRPRFPQMSILGLQLSDKNFPTVSTQSWWQTKITNHKNAGFPFDVQVHDNRWRAGTGAWSGSWFEFSTERWPDPAGFKTWANANGVTTVLDYNRNNSKDMAGWVAGPPPGYSFQSADITNVQNNDAVPDWSYSSTRSWVWNVFWTKALDPSLNFPSDGLWIDEPDELGPIPYNATAANGWKWSELRNNYFLLALKGIGQDGWDPNTTGHIGHSKRPWTFTRGATAGQQRYGHLWTGDIDSSYSEMQMQIRGMQAAGLGGLPYANIDGGGFHGGVISDGMYRNWPAAWSSFSPIWRPHGAGDTSSLGAAASRWPLDQSSTEQADFLKYGKLRYTLMPYIYTIAHDAHMTGMPMARAMVIDYQYNSKAYTSDLQYMWGPSMIVTPLTSDSSIVQNIWLPAGDTWYNFWYDVKTVGSDTEDKAYTTTTGEMPIFVRSGAILPKYAYAQSTASINKSRLEMEVYTGKDGSFAVYEDDGVTENFRVNSANSTTNLVFTNSATRIVVSHPAGTYSGAPTKRTYVVRFHGLSSPVGMRVNGGATLPAFASEEAAIANGSGEVWDSSKKILTVVTPLINVVTNGGTAATIEPSGEAFPSLSNATVYQAENAALNGAIVNSNHSGYTGTGFADYLNNSNDYIEWTVNISTSGTHTLNFRYANGATTNRPLSISVNGTVVNSSMAFNTTDNWTTWDNTTLNASLPAGS
ncbi:MAG TPA: TIM-barrel domain-containing protein, partial [Bacilli bacterium]